MVRVVMETGLGEIELEIDPTRAPVTAGNFLHYVDAGLYTGGSFYRTVKPDNQPNNDVRIEVIQGGIDAGRTDERLPPIALERTTATGLRHLDGTVSMSRFAPDSAHSEIFICIGDQPELDFGGRRYTDGQGFAAFGRVTRGMDVVRRIQLAPAEGQRLVPPVLIPRVRRLRGSDGA
jgi:peptidyl-prolyl cis-trans isomerase A (cyclophilin A)